MNSGDRLGVCCLAGAEAPEVSGWGALLPVAEARLEVLVAQGAVLAVTLAQVVEAFLGSPC